MLQRARRCRDGRDWASGEYASTSILDLACHVIERDPRQAAALAVVAGVVDEHADARPRLARPLRRPPASSPSSVTSSWSRRQPGLARLLDRLEPARARVDGPAAAGQPLRRRAADPRRAAGDENGARDHRSSLSRLDSVARYGLLSLSYRLRRPRHGRGPRHRQHARVRARARHRPLGAVGRGDRPAHRRGARGRRRGETDARAHPGHDRRDPPAQGRRHRRLRRHRADAPAFHPEGAPAPLCAPARRRLRPVGRHGRREARRRGGDALRGRAPGLPDRGADGCRDRRRASRSPSRPGT